MSSRIAIVAAVIGAHAVTAQTPAPQPQFEVASVKQIDRSGEPERGNRSKTDLSFLGTAGNPFKIAGNRVSIRSTALALIAAAYDVQNFQIANTPAWADALIYTVEAKTEGDNVPTASMVRPMLQSLLSDRFQLRLHRENRTTDVLNLVVRGRSGAFKPAAAEEVFSWKLTKDPNGMLRSKATKEWIGDFVRLVGVSEERPVIDKTGITGYIDYDILIATPEAQTQDDVNRAIVDAVKDQLGLKLEPAKEPIETLVVDRIEKPSEN